MAPTMPIASVFADLEQAAIRRIDFDADETVRRIELAVSDNVSSAANGAIDFGLSWDYDFLPRPMGNLSRSPLLMDLMCLLLPRDHPLAEDQGPISLGQLAGELWVLADVRNVCSRAF